MKGEPHRILVSAYACNPRMGSEEAVGWGWVRAIAAHHDLTVITAAFNRRDIESWAQETEEGRPPIRFVYVPSLLTHEKSLWVYRHLGPSAFLSLYTNFWQRRAFRVARQLHREQPFGLAHNLTYVGFRVPGYLWKLGIPFVWGPIGGLEQTRWRLLPGLGLKGLLYYSARNFFNTCDKYLRPGVRRAMRAADGGLIAATSGIHHEIKRLYGLDSHIISEVGLPPLTQPDPTTLSRRADGEPLRLIWIGNLLPGKALPFLLRVLPRFSEGQGAEDRGRPRPPQVEDREDGRGRTADDPVHKVPERRGTEGQGDGGAVTNWTLEVFGDGSEEKSWKRLAERNGLSSRIRWHGRVPREQVLQALRSAHLLVITSVYDLTSTVTVEALANGVPVLCPDHCGFRDAVSETCGIRFPAGNVREFEAGLPAGLRRIHDDEPFRQRLARGALERAKAYDWDLKARQVDEIYRRVLERWKGRGGEERPVSP